ncbi:hypothetical protein OY671_007998, partial [Metschnikowia pulcherrima]
GQALSRSWWGCWIGGNILATSAQRSEDVNHAVATVLGFGATASLAGSAWFLYRIVGEITEAQQARETAAVRAIAPLVPDHSHGPDPRQCLRPADRVRNAAGGIDHQRLQAIGCQPRLRRVFRAVGHQQQPVVGTEQHADQRTVRRFDAVSALACGHRVGAGGKQQERQQQAGACAALAFERDKNAGQFMPALEHLSRLAIKRPHASPGPQGRAFLDPGAGPLGSAPKGREAGSIAPEIHRIVPPDASRDHAPVEIENPHEFVTRERHSRHGARMGKGNDRAGGSPARRVRSARPAQVRDLRRVGDGAVPSPSAVSS